MTREKFHYTATVAGSNGSTHELPFETYWSPSHDGILGDIADAAAAQLNARESRAKSELRYAGLAARLAEPDAIAA